MATAIKASANAGVKDTMQFPSNIIPEDEKEREKWAHRWVDAIQMYSQVCFREHDIENYQYAQGNIQTAEFSHVTNLYVNNKKLNKVLPAKIRQINAIAPFLNRIMGKLDAQDIQFNAAMTNEDAVTEKLNNLIDKQVEDITRLARQQSGVQQMIGRPVEEGDDVIPVNPQDIEKRNMTTFQQENEIEVSKALRYLMKKNNLQYKFIHQAFYNYLITGKMAFDNDIDLDDPNADPIDSRYLVYDLDSRSPFIQHGRFAGYWFNATPQEVLDRCPNLSKEDLAYVDELQHKFSDGTLKGPSIFWNRNYDLNVLYLNSFKCKWKACKKQWVKLSPNKFDDENPHAHFVTEKEKKEYEKTHPNNTETEFEIRYYNVEWECTKIGEKIYYQCREKPNQLRNDDEPSEIDLSICGIVDINPCPVDLLKPLQNLRIQAFYNIELLASQTMGKILIVDERLEEDSEDNIYNMRAFKVFRVNTAKEGEMQLGMQPQMPKEVDMGMSEAVNDLIRLVAFIDQNMANITGINEPAQGIVKSDQGLGVTQNAIEAAQLTIQPYYAVFYIVAEMALQQICDLMRPAWSGRKKTAYWIGDKGADFFDLSPETDWHLAKYGIFVQNSVGANQSKELMLRMAGQLLPVTKDPNFALTILKMFNSKSAAEAEEIFEKGVEAINKIQQEVQSQQAQAQQAAAQAAQQMQAEKLKIESDKNQVVLQKTSMEQQGETQRTEMKLGHDANKQTVKKKDEVDLMTAEHLLNQEQNNNLASPKS